MPVKAESGNASVTRRKGSKSAGKKRNGDEKSAKGESKLFLTSYNKVLSMAKQALTTVKHVSVKGPQHSQRTPIGFQSGSADQSSHQSHSGTPDSESGIASYRAAELPKWSRLLLRIRKAEIARLEAVEKAWQEWAAEKAAAQADVAKEKAEEEAAIEAWIVAWKGEEDAKR